ncbi:MAG: lipoprotein-releasing system ATP-binding protein [Candidatus Sumerlaeota bacterium]|nr:lipoprotein-releasing system ATP-binding protein [Candidatus Sumerlaeota bacterium]
MTMTKTRRGKPAQSPESSNGAVLRASGVRKSYRDGDRTLEVLRGLDFELHAGEFVAIIGQSGSGKSTLLHILGALDRVTTGTVALNGRDYATLSAAQLDKVRATQIGFIYQFHHLLPEFSALENTFIPGMIQRRPTPALIARATSLLERVGLGERLGHRPVKLSGGEQQRVALARALMNDPAVVLADEPTGDLDQKTGQEVLDFVLSQTAGEGKSLVIVTHDPAIAARANRVYTLENGRLNTTKT